MDGLTKLLRNELLKIVDNINVGNSNMSEEDMTQTVLALRKYTHKDEVMTKTEAYEFLSISRAAFDNLVLAGELPRGEKLHKGDSNLFWKVSDLTIYKEKRKQRKVTTLRD